MFVLYIILYKYEHCSKIIFGLIKQQCIRDVLLMSMCVVHVPDLFVFFLFIFLLCIFFFYFHSFLSYCREFLAELEDCIDDPVEVANKFVSKVVWSNVVLNLCSNIFHN